MATGLLKMGVMGGLRSGWCWVSVDVNGCGEWDGRALSYLVFL